MTPFGSGRGSASSSRALGRLGSLGKVDRVVAHWLVPCAFPLGMAVRAPLDVHASNLDVVRQRVLLGHQIGLEPCGGFEL